VGAADLLHNERFWPYRVSLRRAWQAPGSERTLPAGSTGVLIRVEDADSARIDFGRDGIHRVPVAETDLVENVNRVRLGELAKTAPNFVFALGPRLLDSGAEPLAPVPLAKVLARRAFVTVFADVEQFQPIARDLSGLTGRAELMTIVVPQGMKPDAEVRDRLRELGWKVPFVYRHLAEAYTPSLLPDAMAPPAVMLQTAEGRVLFASTWGEGVGARLATALGRELGGEPAP
jgi:hypothetical protein